jgi:hypothetical protein
VPCRVCTRIHRTHAEIALQTIPQLASALSDPSHPLIIDLGGRRFTPDGLAGPPHAACHSAQEAPNLTHPFQLTPAQSLNGNPFIPRADSCLGAAELSELAASDSSTGSVHPVDTNARTDAPSPRRRSARLAHASRRALVHPIRRLIFREPDAQNATQLRGDGLPDPANGNRSDEEDMTGDDGVTDRDPDSLGEASVDDRQRISANFLDVNRPGTVLCNGSIELPECESSTVYRGSVKSCHEQFCHDLRFHLRASVMLSRRIFIEHVGAVTMVF